MASVHGICASFKLELVQGIHDFRTDTIKLALYTSAATLNIGTTAYTTTNEVSGAGYTPGGEIVTPSSGFPKLNPLTQGDVGAGSMMLVDFEDTEFPLVYLSDVRAGLLYNSTKANRAIAVIDFGTSYNPDGQFNIVWPTGDPANAIIRGY